jgi:hypothetical protein
LFDDGGHLRWGWSLLSYDANQGRLGGYLLIRHKGKTGDYSFEATVPLSNTQDSRFVIPVDNIQGFNTYVTLVNPSMKTTHLKLYFYALDGTFLFTDGGPLSPGQQLLLSIPDAYPNLRDALCTLYVEADTSLLSSSGVRIQSNTGAVAGVPIMNWAGMF